MAEPVRVVAGGYDTISDRYAEWAREIRGDPRHRYVERLLTLLPGRPDILEIGCGAGVEPTPTLARIGTLAGIDVSTAQLERARRALPEGSFVLGDVLEARFAARSFDAVVALYVLTHVPTSDLQGLLRRIGTWLRPGGVFLGTFGARVPHDTFVDDWLGAPSFFSGLSTDENERLVVHAGLAIAVSQVESMLEPVEHGSGFEVARFHWILATAPRAGD